MWECGLKPATAEVTAPEKESLLMWECGLKHALFKKCFWSYSVTPYVGVWIETFRASSV